MHKKTLTALALGLTALSAEAGNFYVVVPAHKTATLDAAGSSIMPSPVLVSLFSMPLPVGIVGSAYSADLTHALQVSGDPSFTGGGVTWKVVAGGLPSGLTLVDGVISGTPTKAEQADFTVKASYLNADGQQTYQIVTLQLAVTLAAATLPSGVGGEPYQADLNRLLKVTGDPNYDGSGVSWRIVAGKLPSGLVLSDGVISGSPVGTETQNFTVAATYKTKTGEQVYQLSTLTIYISLAATALPEAFVGSSYRYDLNPLLSITGDPAYAGTGVAWRVVSGNLPAGVTLQDGVVSGTPTEAASGYLVVEAAYRNKAGQQTYQLQTLKLSVVLLGDPLPDAEVGKYYMYEMTRLLQITGDPAYYGNGVTWRIASGSLPAGLILSANGIISGTPSAVSSGTPLTIEATYKSHSGQQTYVFKVVNIVVNLGAATIPSGNLKTPYVGYDFKNNLSVTGDPNFDSAGVSFTASKLPSGMTMDGAGVLTGKPDVANSTGTSFQVTANYKNKAGTQTYTLIVNGQVLQVTSISAGMYHTCAVTTAGGVKCWGNNNAGQLGDGTKTKSTVPVDVVGLSSGVVKVSAGVQHSCAVTSAGGVKCWGSNANYQLGFSGVESLTPYDVYNLSSGVVDVGTGQSHTCALTATGDVKCWGANNYGQLGDGTTAIRYQPANVKGLPAKVTQLSTGVYHNCALLNDSGVTCWGAGAQGQIGNGANGYKTTPVLILSGAVSVGVGAYHSCAVMSSGSLSCWGQNNYSQLGDGTTSPYRNVPSAVAGAAKYTKVRGAFAGTCAITNQGGLQCWGTTAYTNNTTYPVDKPGLASGISEISGLGNHLCVSMASSARCFGSNSDGQLGGTPIAPYNIADVYTP